jgi:methylase of polypeptide subunit release factors
MWRNASWGSGGFLVPDVESLLVFLAVHVVGHSFERPQWHENVRRCAKQVERWDEVWRIAAEAKVTRALRAALEGRPAGHVEPLLDGPRGWIIWHGSLVLRGHIMPERWRAEARERVALWRQGFGISSAGKIERCSFHGFTFEVDKGVFPPKRVSEELVNLALMSVAGSASPTIVEMGTGTGAISVALARRLPDSTVLASDVSPRAVRCAKRNASRAGVAVSVSLGSLMSAIPTELYESVDVVVGNLPYVDPRGAAQVEDWGAPSHAIVGGGSDGLDLVREGALHAAKFLRPGGWLVFQIADWQFDVFKPELEEFGYRCETPTARRPGKALTARAQWGLGG